MVPRSVLISKPDVDFDTLINACQQALGRSVSIAVDNTSKKLSSAERFLSILSAIKDEHAGVELSPHLLPHASFSVLTVADDLDILDMVEACSGMYVVKVETTKRGVIIAVISGTMQQWRDAVVTGSQTFQPDIVRLGFNEIHNLFVGAGLGAVWNDYQQQPLREGYSLIEFRP